MAHAHGRGVVHRDLKPANVMVGPGGQVVVMDWGVAAVRGSSPGSEQGGYWVFGTPAYMPPEQARGRADADPRTDVFGLGGLLCEILTGQPPYVGPDAAAVTRLAAAGDQSELTARLANSGADRALVALTRACLAPDPADRPADAGQVARLVGDHRTAREGRDRHRGRPAGDGGPYRRVAGLLTAAAALAAATLIGATARDLQAPGRTGPARRRPARRLHQQTARRPAPHANPPPLPGDPGPAVLAGRVPVLRGGRRPDRDRGARVVWSGDGHPARHRLDERHRRSGRRDLGLGPVGER